MSVATHLRGELEVLRTIWALLTGAPDPRAQRNPPEPPLALVGLQRLPILGIFWRLKAIITEPTEYAMRCRAAYGDIFTIRIPFNFDLTYVTSKDAYRQILTLDPAVGQMGPVMMNVPTVGYWYPRSDLGADWLQAMMLASRRYLATDVMTRARFVAMEPVIQRTLDQHLARWGEVVNLSEDLVALIFDAAGRCIAGEALWDRIGEAIRPLFRTIVNGIDIVHTTMTVVFGRFTAEARATARLQRILDTVLAEHRETGAFPILDEIAAIEVNGAPLPEADRGWMLMYLIWNALIYPGTYGVWALLDLLGDPAYRERVQRSEPHQQSRLLHLALVETIRVNPVASLVRKPTTPQDFLVDGRPYRVALGGYVGVLPWAQCHDQNAYHAPQTYDPGRYLDGAPMPPVFGRGPFGCVAQGFVRLLLGTLHRELLDRYDWTLLDPVPARRSRVHLTYPSARIRARRKVRVACARATANPDLEAALEETLEAQVQVAK